MIKISLVAVISVLICIQLKSLKGEYSVYISLVTCVIIFYFGISNLKSIITLIERLKSYSLIGNGYFSILIKIIGITYISEFSSEICKDAGYGAIASQLEIAGKLTILVISMPIVMAILEVIEGVL